MRSRTIKCPTLKCALFIRKISCILELNKNLIVVDFGWTSPLLQLLFLINCSLGSRNLFTAWRTWDPKFPGAVIGDRVFSKSFENVQNTNETCVFIQDQIVQTN